MTKKNNKSFQEQVKTTKVVKAPVEVVNLTNKDRKAIDKVVKTQLFKELNVINKGLPEEFQQIAKDLANGKVKKEIMTIYQITGEEFEELSVTPAFQTELRRITYEETYAEKDMRVRDVNKGLTMLTTALSNRINEASDPDMISLDKLLKAHKDYIDLMNKMMEKETPQIKVDITQIIQQESLERKPKSTDKEGNEVVGDFYPTLDENGNVIGEWDGIDG